MGLLANGFRDTLGAFQTFGATASNNAYPSARRANYARTAAARNITAGQGITDGTVSLPSGNRHPNVWMMPQKAGALAARNEVSGEGGVTNADVWAVKLAEAAIGGSGDAAAIGGLVVQLIAALTGSGTVSAANVQAFLAAVASLSGSGTLAGTATGYGALVAALAGSGTAEGSTATGLGELGASLVVTGTGLSTANVGDAVWQYIIESGLSAEDVQRILLAGIAGKTAGIGTTTEEYMAQDGVTPRITTEFDINGNRDNVVLDGD